MSLVFVWAGGSGVSALVSLMIDLNIPDLVCIDAHDSIAMKRFHQHWIDTYIWHGKYEPKPGDLLVYSAATATSIEVKTGFDYTFDDPLAPPPLLYAEFLGELSKYMYTLAISGTHGKSTTTWMAAVACIAHIPESALAIVGAWVTEWQWGHCWHNPKHYEALRALVLHTISRKATALHLPYKQLLFIVEADEFNHHFLFLEPDISIITSLDHDHVDIYPTHETYLAAFDQFCTATKETIVTLPSLASQLPNQKPKIFLPTIESFDFASLIGGHNHTNASLALAWCILVADHFGHEKNVAMKASIEQFQWLRRRAEFLGKNNQGVAVYSDYGHHPDEIRSTLFAFQEKYPTARLTCFFEAHQAKRLLTFWEAFIDAFAWRTCVVVPVYTAREDEIMFQTQENIEKTKSTPVLNHVKTFEDLAKAFASEVHGENIVERSALAPALHSISQWIIICFGAWILDDKLREIFVH